MNDILKIKEEKLNSSFDFVKVIVDKTTNHINESFSLISDLINKKITQFENELKRKNNILNSLTQFAENTILVLNKMMDSFEKMTNVIESLFEQIKNVEKKEMNNKKSLIMLCDSFEDLIKVNSN